MSHRNNLVIFALFFTQYSIFAQNSTAPALPAHELAAIRAEAQAIRNDPELTELMTGIRNGTNQDINEALAEAAKLATNGSRWLGAFQNKELACIVDDERNGFRASLSILGRDCIELPLKLAALLLAYAEYRKMVMLSRDHLLRTAFTYRQELRSYLELLRYDEKGVVIRDEHFLNLNNFLVERCQPKKFDRSLVRKNMEFLLLGGALSYLEEKFELQPDPFLLGSFKKLALQLPFTMGSKEISMAMHNAGVRERERALRNPGNGAQQLGIASIFGTTRRANQQLRTSYEVCTNFALGRLQMHMEHDHHGDRGDLAFSPGAIICWAASLVAYLAAGSEANLLGSGAQLCDLLQSLVLTYCLPKKGTPDGDASPKIAGLTALLNFLQSPTFNAMERIGAYVYLMGSLNEYFQPYWQEFLAKNSRAFLLVLREETDEALAHLVETKFSCSFLSWWKFKQKKLNFISFASKGIGLLPIGATWLIYKLGNTNQSQA